jgi:cob(I)alamin adenosyltransferase
MDEKRFAEPTLRIDRVVTRGGDGGETSVIGGARMPKDAARIEAYGTVDELNAQLGVALTVARDVAAQHAGVAELAAQLRRVQHEAFNLGTVLATPPERLDPRRPQITDAEIARLEREIDASNAHLPALSSFVLPGGSRLSAALHVCRAVCRRAERCGVRLLREEPDTPAVALRYLNRLSDALFVWSRAADALQGVAEALWDPNAPDAP